MSFRSFREPCHMYDLVKYDCNYEIYNICVIQRAIYCFRKNNSAFFKWELSTTIKCLLFFISSFQNESRSPPVSCFSKQRKKYHKSLSKASTSGMCSGYTIHVRLVTNNKLCCVPNIVYKGIISNLCRNSFLVAIGTSPKKGTHYQQGDVNRSNTLILVCLPTTINQICHKFS